jgi:protein disulfide-isomerase
MKWLIVCLASSFLLCGYATAAETVSKEGSTPSSESPLLPWTTDFDKALAVAKADSLPIYLYFTGSSWCIWCKKMDREIHNQDAFRQKTVGKMLFVKIDLPAGSQPNEATRILLDKYNVHGVPTVVLLSPNGDELARFRYQQMPPDQYADIVLKAASQQKESANRVASA